MAQTFILPSEDRPKVGTNASKQVRKKGLTPAVMYGHGEGSSSIAVNLLDLTKAVRQGVRVFDITLNGATQKTLLRALQWDAFGAEIVHADFYRVRADEKITLEVRVELRGVAPGIAAGGTLVQPIHSLSVECLVVAIPESIRVSVAELQLNQAIHVKDLQLPEGVKVKNDPDAIVVQISQKASEEEAPTGGLAAEQAEPEVIARAKGDEEEEAEKK